MTNPTKHANTFSSNGMPVSDKTIGTYIGYLLDAFFISKAERYNIKGKRLEVDFVCNLGSRRYYIQSAFAIPDQEKMEQEENSLVRIDDFFKKIIVVKDKIKLWHLPRLPLFRLITSHNCIFSRLESTEAVVFQITVLCLYGPDDKIKIDKVLYKTA